MRKEEALRGRSTSFAEAPSPDPRALGWHGRTAAPVATAPANQRRRASEAEFSDLASATHGGRGLLLGCVAEEGVEGAGHGEVPRHPQLADG